MTNKQGPVCISVINMKGGVGKTTVATMLARYGSRQGLKVLAVDLDPQANLSQALMGRRYQQFLDGKMPSIVEVFKGHQPPTQGNPFPSPLSLDDVIRRPESGLELIPSRFDFSDNLIDSTKPDPTVLARLIANHFQENDLVIVDCAPTESIFTQVAYHASRYIIVPVKPEFLSTIGFPLLRDSLRSFCMSNPGHQIDVLGVVINDFSEYLSQKGWAPERRRAIREIRQRADLNGWHVFQNQLTYSRGFPKIMRNDLSHSGDAFSIFNRFAREVFGRLGI